MSQKFGGKAYLAELFRQLKLQPSTPSRTDREQRALNLYHAAEAACKKTGCNSKEIRKFFKNTLRWSFIP